MPTEDNLEENNDELQYSNGYPCNADLQSMDLEVKENKLDAEISGTANTDVEKDREISLPAVDLDQDLIKTSSFFEVTVGVKEVFLISEDDGGLNSGMQSENGSIRERSPVIGDKREGSPVSNSLSSTKKARTTIGEEQPSVRVIFNFLTRDSKRKLEELLQNWSEWNAKHPFSSHDCIDELESGEQTYFPALRVGLSDSSAVSVWMDEAGSQYNKDNTPLDYKSIPLYDRGYSWALTSSDVSSNLEGGLERMDSSRCFNCGAYDHALKDCLKPRDNAAVNNARKEHNSKRNLNPNSRNPTRYYQDSSGGKYDGLRPGALDAETRKLLGIGELDPPPWLNRMLQLGYPPGYLDPDEEDQPSGISIFGDEENKEAKETEDGEILDTDFLEPLKKISPDPPRKQSVQFPGINAPIPENADQSRWCPSNSDFYTNYMNRTQQRSNHFSERNTFPDQRWSRDSKNDHSRYGDADSSFTFQRERGIIFATPVNPSLERSFSERGRWSSTHNDSPHHGSYNSRQNDDRRNDFESSHSSRYRDRDRDRDRDDNHHPYRRR